MATGYFRIALQLITATGTYTPTTGMRFCLVIATGPGAGSGGIDADAAASRAAAGGGGGAGGTAIGLFTAAQIGASQAVTIGAAGTGGPNTGGPGGATSPTTFGALLTANGGNPGGGAQATQPVFAVAGGAGGSASGGIMNIAGGNGGEAQGFAIDGTNDVVWARSGQGGASFWGGGGQERGLIAAALNSVLTVAGITPGVAGAGASGPVSLNDTAGQVGAPGTAGVVLVLEFCDS